MKKKTVALLMACVMALGCAIGGSLAWLTASDDPVVNTFTPSDIDIELTETFNKNTDNVPGNDTWEKKMIPGHVLEKDPKVTVKAVSEDCWLFVQVAESNDLNKYITYDMASGWTQLKDKNNADVAGVYYRKVLATDTEKSFDVIGYKKTDDTFVANQVKVNDTVTKTDMKDIADGKATVTLTFTAYASQLYKTNPHTTENEFSAFDAWTNAQPPVTP